MKRFKRFARSGTGLHEGADGNAMIFVVIVLFTLVCFFVFSIHVGQRFTHKVEMQNAADAAVISGAVWKARGLNLISLLNVSMSECLALIIMFKAFNDTLRVAQIGLKISKIIAKACMKVPYTAAVCAVWYGILVGYEQVPIRAYKKANDVMKKTYKSGGILWKAMKALKKISQAVSPVTSIIAYKQASDIAKYNGADALIEVGGIGYHAVMWPYQLTLPVDDGSFEVDLCDHTWNGGDGYRNYLCYDNALDVSIAGIGVDDTIEKMWLILSLILPPPILFWEPFKEAHYHDLCSSSGSSSDSTSVTISEYTVQCDKCAEEEGESRWVGQRIELSRNECDDQWAIEHQNDDPIGIGEKTFTDGRRPDGRLLDNGTDAEEDQTSNAQQCRVCDNLQVVAPTEEGQSPRYFADIWIMASCSFGEEEREIEIETDDHDGDKVPPLVLDDDWKDKVKYTTLVYKEEFDLVEDEDDAFRGYDGKPIFQLKSDMSGEMITYGEDGDSLLKNGHIELPKHTWSMARAIVYNPGQEDLFNQNWHAKLAPLDVKGLQPNFQGKSIPLLDKAMGFADDVVEEVLAH